MKKQEKRRWPYFGNVSLVEFFALLIAIGYMQSVLTVANHVGMWVHDGSTHIVPAPSRMSLGVSLLLIAYACYRRKGRFSGLMLVSLTILATASIFWLSGLRTNFYF